MRRRWFLVLWIGVDVSIWGNEAVITGLGECAGFCDEAGEGFDTRRGTEDVT